MSRYESALETDQPVTTLREAVRSRLSEGVRPEELLRELDELRHALEDSRRHEQEESVAEVMDMLEGWTSPYLDLSRPAPPR